MAGFVGAAAAPRLGPKSEVDGRGPPGAAAIARTQRTKPAERRAYLVITPSSAAFVTASMRLFTPSLR